MFPLNWNIPFIRKNGSRTTLGAITGDIAGIEEDITELTDKADGFWDNMMDNGAVNMCPNNANSNTDNEVTWTVNADKTVTAVVASTVVTSKELTLYINDDGSPNLVGKRVRLTGCPSGGSENTYRVHVARAESTDGSTGTSVDYGNGIEFTWLNNGSGTKAAVRIKIMEGCPAGTYVFKPMLSDPSLNLSYDDYVPYAKTNRELTEVKTTSVTAKGLTLNIVKSGNVCVSRFSGSLTENVALDTTILTIPDGYKPISLVTFNTTNKVASTSNFATINYADNGAVQPSGTGVATGDALRGSACWITAP